VRRDQLDLLWSANLTLALGDRMNVRAAGYRTVSRPDPREISPGEYVPVAGECITLGTPGLNRATILNADLRWEWYPAPGELVSLSGFYKHFDDPIIEIVGARQSGCEISPRNASSALNVGAEAEVRKGLGFLADPLEHFTATLNFTFVEGHVEFDVGGDVGLTRFDLQDQSRYLINGSLSYSPPNSAFSATVLYNYFNDRPRRYGFYSVGIGKVPDVVELGRATVDAKITRRIGRFDLSLSGRNLTDARVQEVQVQTTGAVPVGYARPGVSLSLGIGYAF
jgi:outer membrane receptor protein involved in Fe transport